MVDRYFSSSIKGVNRFFKLENALEIEGKDEN